MRLIDKTFWPLLFIAVLLTVATIAEAQDKLTVDKWRLEKACKELVLLDSLVKDYAKKDSVITDLKSLIKTLKSDIEALSGVATERKIQVENLLTSRIGYEKEIDIWRTAYAREKWKRWSVSIGMSANYGLIPNTKLSVGPAVHVGYSVFKF